MTTAMHTWPYHTFGVGVHQGCKPETVVGIYEARQAAAAAKLRAMEQQARDDSDNDRPDLIGPDGGKGAP